MNLTIFLITLAAHAPFIFLAQDKAQLKPPEIIVSYQLDKYSPTVVFGSNYEDVIFEVEYLTPYGMEAFRTNTTISNFDLVYGAPCHVRVRARNGSLVSGWSKPIFVSDKKTVDFLSLWKPFSF